MKRRQMLRMAATIGLGSLVSGKSWANVPCPPLLAEGQGSTACADTALARACNRLALGQHSDFTKNTLQSEWDIQWQTRTIYYDPSRKELQYVGKPATSQSQNWSHYIYKESTDQWTTTGQSLFPSFGHAWSTAFDPSTGNYFLHRYNEDKLRYYHRASGQWRESPTISGLGGDNAQPIAAMGWHPNLFGTGRGGVLCWGRKRIYTFDPASNDLNVAGDCSGVFFQRAAGQGVYLQTRDELICGALDGKTGGTESVLVSFAKGSGQSSDVIGQGLAQFVGYPPIPIVGGNGDRVQGKMTEHPTRAGVLVLLEGLGQSRVWESSDGGASWQLQPFKHPFNAMPPSSKGHFTIGTIQAYGVIVGMKSDGSGGTTRLWKPNA